MEKNFTPENYGLRIKNMKVNNAREVFLSVEQVRRIASFCTLRMHQPGRLC